MNSNYKTGFTKRLANDQYVRPAKTRQDMYTADEIKQFLEDYEQVDNINEIALNTHLRYFSIVTTGKKKEKKFRRGGMLVKNDPKQPFIVLSNGTSSWSVQKDNSDFYRKRTLDEIKAGYEDDIDDLKYRVSKAEKIIRNQKKLITQLQDELSTANKKVKKSSKK